MFYFRAVISEETTIWKNTKTHTLRWKWNERVKGDSYSWTHTFQNLLKHGNASQQQIPFDSNEGL